MTVLKVLQRSIEDLQGISTTLDVSAFVVSDAERQQLPGARRELPEQLFLSQIDGNLDIGLYVAPDVVAQLESDDPHASLHGGNLESYWVALEGVSHFVMVAYRAQLGRPVSMLELEIQAEVDKFVHSWLLLTAQGASARAAACVLLHGLFERYELQPGLSPDDAQRYHLASQAARQFCRALAARRATPAEMKRAARDFFRTGLAEKMRG